MPLWTSLNLIGFMYYIGIHNIHLYKSSRIIKQSFSWPKNGLHRSFYHYKQLFQKLFTCQLKPLILGIHYILNVVTWLLNELAYFFYLAHEWLSTNYFLGTYWCSIMTMCITWHLLSSNLCSTCFDHSIHTNCSTFFNH